MPIIIIVKKQSGCFIVPPHTPAKKDDTVRFSAVNTAVEINFPGPPIFTDQDNQFRIEAG